MKTTRPNVVLILNDDMGYSDLGCYGGEVQTPNLERLAKNGVRFSQLYNTARCSPSRASLLTGLHPHQTGIGVLTYNMGPEGYAGNLNRKCLTIPEALKASGYRSYLSGKWHVAGNLTQPTDAWPMQRGFDEFFGTIIGAGSWHTVVKGHEVALSTPLPDGSVHTGVGFYGKDAADGGSRDVHLSDFAIEGDVREHAHLDGAHAERRAVEGRARVQRRDVQRHGDDAPEGARADRHALAVDRVELDDLAARRHARALAFREQMLGSIMPDDPQVDHARAP
jgi:arylsulfatase A-like enzyme